jgi:D-sedoheptulose 7-phosphate isomerase
VSTINYIPLEPLWEAIHLIQQTRRNEYQQRIRDIFIIGNGGSAATASHFAADMNKSLGGFDNTYCLSDSIPLFSAYANDEGYKNVFREQLKPRFDYWSTLIIFSVSGRSPNVVAAARYVKEEVNNPNTMTIAFTGRSGNDLTEWVDILVEVPSDNVRQVEDVHLMLAHLICECLQRMG